MIAIICVDDSFGMLFNKRRQSRDEVLNKKILELSKNSRLWMNSYSFEIFDDLDATNINIAEDYLEKAQPGDYCFVENDSLLPLLQNVEKIILCKWNRTYPSDFVFDVPLDSWDMIESDEFAGKSHEKITMEVYIK